MRELKQTSTIFFFKFRLYVHRERAGPVKINKTWFTSRSALYPHPFPALTECVLELNIIVVWPSNKYVCISKLFARAGRHYKGKNIAVSASRLTVNLLPSPGRKLFLVLPRVRVGVAKKREQQEERHLVTLVAAEYFFIALTPTPLLIPTNILCPLKKLFRKKMSRKGLPEINFCDKSKYFLSLDTVIYRCALWHISFITQVTLLF